MGCSRAVFKQHTQPRAWGAGTPGQAASPASLGWMGPVSCSSEPWAWGSCLGGHCRVVYPVLNHTGPCSPWLPPVQSTVGEAEKPKALTALIAGALSHHIHVVWRPDHFPCYRENPSGFLIPDPKSNHGFSPEQVSEAEVVVARPCFISVSISASPVWKSGLPQHWQYLLTS